MQPIRRRSRLSALLAGAVVASSLATAVATTALAPNAGAVNGQPTAVSTACNYRPFDGKWHMADVEWTATPSVTTVAPQGVVSLSGTTLETTLLPEMAQIGYSAGYFKPGVNNVDIDVWVGIESVNASPRFQVVKGTGTATTTITVGTGGTVQATPIVANMTVPDTTWTATTNNVSFRPAPAGTVAGYWPNVGSLPGDKTGGIQGGQYVVAELPGTGTPFELTLDCYPGTVDIDGNPEANSAPAPFATVGSGPVDPEEPEEPEEPVEGDWACISGPGAGTGSEIVPADVAVSLPSVPQVIGTRVVLPKVRTTATVDAAAVTSMYRSGQIAAGTTSHPITSWAYLAGTNAAERTAQVKSTGTWTSVVTDPTPEDRANGDDTAEPVTLTLDSGPSFWTPVANGPVTFSLAPPATTGALPVSVTRPDTSTYNLRPYGQVAFVASTDTTSATVDCLVGGITVSNSAVAYAEVGNYSPTVSGTNPVPGSRGRYTAVAGTLTTLGSTTYGDASANTFECISGLGRFRGREIEPMAISVRQPEVTVSGGKVRVPRTLVDITVTEGLLKSLYQGNQLVNGTNTHKLFGWVYLNGSNTVERTKRLPVETVWQTTVNDPTPADKLNGDETVTQVEQTLDFGASTWTPVGRGDVTFSLVNPGGNSAPTIDVVGKGYADTPYTIRPYGNVFLRAETATYGANLDCSAGKTTIADPAIAFHNFGNNPVNVDNLKSGSRGRYAFTPTPAAAISQVVYGTPAVDNFDCISGLGRFRGREIDPFKIAVAFPASPTESGSKITVPSVKVDVNVLSGLLKSLYAGGQFDNAELATEFTTTQKLEGWVLIEGTNTVEKTQRLYLDTEYSVAIEDPTPENKTNSDETISGFDKTFTFGPSTWTPTGPSKVDFSLGEPGRDDAPKINVVGTGYADTPYSIRPYGNVFLRAGTDHYGANLDCVSGGVSIADPAIGYHNFGNDPVNADSLKSGSRGRYTFAPQDIALGQIRTGTAVERFLNNTYKNPAVLGRPSVNAWGLDHYGSRLAAGESRTSVVTHIVRSDASSDRYIRAMYQDLLGRQPAASMISSWKARFAAGWTREQLVADLLASSEFRTKAGGTNVGVVEAMFTKTLRRSATDAELVSWSAKLQTRKPADVAAELLRSDSARRIVIADAYAVTFGRGITPAQRTAYLKLMQQGANRQAILVRIVTDAASAV